MIYVIINMEEGLDMSNIHGISPKTDIEFKTEKTVKDKQLPEGTDKTEEFATKSFKEMEVESGEGNTNFAVKTGSPETLTKVGVETLKVGPSLDDIDWKDPEQGIQQLEKVLNALGKADSDVKENISTLDDKFNDLLSGTVKQTIDKQWRGLGRPIVKLIYARASNSTNPQKVVEMLSAKVEEDTVFQLISEFSDAMYDSTIDKLEKMDNPKYGENIKARKAKLEGQLNKLKAAFDKSNEPLRDLEDQRESELNNLKEKTAEAKDSAKFHRNDDRKKLEKQLKNLGKGELKKVDAKLEEIRGNIGNKENQLKTVNEEIKKTSPIPERRIPEGVKEIIKSNIKSLNQDISKLNKELKLIEKEIGKLGRKKGIKPEEQQSIKSYTQRLVDIKKEIQIKKEALQVQKNEFIRYEQLLRPVRKKVLKAADENKVKTLEIYKGVVEKEKKSLIFKKISYIDDKKIIKEKYKNERVEIEKQITEIDQEIEVMINELHGTRITQSKEIDVKFAPLIEKARESSGQGKDEINRIEIELKRVNDDFELLEAFNTVKVSEEFKGKKLSGLIKGIEKKLEIGYKNLLKNLEKTEKEQESGEKGEARQLTMKYLKVALLIQPEKMKEGFLVEMKI